MSEHTPQQRLWYDVEDIELELMDLLDVGARLRAVSLFSKLRYFVDRYCHAVDPESHISYREEEA